MIIGEEKYKCPQCHKMKPSSCYTTTGTCGKKHDICMDCDELEFKAFMEKMNSPGGQSYQRPRTTIQDSKDKNLSRKRNKWKWPIS